MPYLGPQDGQRRIVQLSQEWGIVLPPAPARLTRPQQVPSFRMPSDDQFAEELLQRHAVDASQIRPKSGITRAFSTNNLKKGKNWDPREILDVLSAWISDGGSPGVAEALIVKLAAAGVDLSGIQKQKSSLLSRRKSLESIVDRTRLLRMAVDRDQPDMIQVLLPHADPLALDACLPAAIRTENLRSVELLVRYGANANQSPDGQDAFRQACVVPGQSDIVSAILQSDGRPSSTCLSQAMVDATKAGCFDSVMLLSRSNADGNHNQCEALKDAIKQGRRDIAVAIAMGNKPPQTQSLNESFQLLFNHESLHPATKLDLAELLLCAGANGDVLSWALERSCVTHFYDMANLLSRHGVSVEHNDALALKTAVSRGQADLVQSLLSNSSALSSSLASDCVSLIPKQASPDVRYILLTWLLRKGASGTPLAEALVDAAQAGDLNSVALLVTPYFQGSASAPTLGTRKPVKSTSYERHEIASADHKNGEALRTAVLRGNVAMAQKILQAPISTDTMSVIFPLARNLPAASRHEMVELFLRGALRGPSLHSALQDAITEDPSTRDNTLIDILLKHEADVNFNGGVGLQAVIARKDIALLATLVQRASPQTAAARIPDAIKVSDDHRLRYDIVVMLFQAGAAIGTEQMAHALLETLREKPVDMSLLRLLVQQSNVDVNSQAPALLTQAIQNPDPKVLDLVLSQRKLGPETTARCLNELAPLPSIEGKSWKLKIILVNSSQRPDLNGVLIHEVQNLIRNSGRTPSLSTLKELLTSGADPNAFKAGALCHATKAASAQITEVLFDAPCRITPASMSLALPHALRIADPMDRLTFTKRMVEGGATATELNRALVHAVRTYPDHLSLIGVLASRADPSDGEALTLAVSNESPEAVELLLQSSQYPDQVRDIILQRVMSVKKRGVRRAMTKGLIARGVSGEAASKALLVAARDGDVELGDLLMANGANISSNNGQAIIEACRGGSVEVLQVLLKTGVDNKKRTLEQGFQAATEVKDLNKRALVFEQLLRNGVRGEVVDAQLQSAVRYGESGEGVLHVLLAAGADINYNRGEAVVSATQSAFTKSLEVMLGAWDTLGNQKKPSNLTLVRAFKASWKLSRDSRWHIINCLFKAGLPITDDMHIALNDAVNEEVPEERLIRLLLNKGASPLANGCKTLIDSTRKAAPVSLRLVFSRDIPSEHVNRAFSGSFTEDNFETWFTPPGLDTARILLEKGACGNALSAALVLVMQKCTPSSEGLATNFVNILAKYDADVDFNHGQPLQIAASKANVPWTSTLLKLHPSPSTLSSAFQRIFDTALTEDAALELFRLFSEYHDGEVQVESALDSPGSEPVLVRAITQYPRSTTIVETLLNAGFYHDQMTSYKIHPEIEEAEEVTLLTWAIAQPQKRVSSAVILLLISRGCNVNVETRLSKTTPLLLAVQTRRPDVVQALLLEGAESDVVDFKGRTPLSLATEIGGDLAIQLMGNILADEPSKDDGSLHNAARALNLPAVKVLVSAGHDPDFPSPVHQGRSALAEVCLRGSGNGDLTAEKEKALQKVMAFLIDAGSDLSIKADGKSILYLCFDSANPIATSKALLKVGMWKYVNKPLNHFTDGTHTYSPTMYIKKVLPSSDTNEALLVLLTANRATEVFYANTGAQPDDAVGLPEDIAVQERARKARAERMVEDNQDFAIALARKRELASTEQQIWAQKVRMEDARRQKLHGEDVAAIRARAQLEESLSSSSAERRMSERRAIASAEMEADNAKRAKALEWETRMGTERVDNERALSSMRIQEREEMERMDRAGLDRMRQKMEAQKALVDSQERLARRIAEGPSGSGDARRQIGYVTEMN